MNDKNLDNMLNAWMKTMDKIRGDQDILNKKIEKEVTMPELEEEIEYTCCGDEITGWVEDYGICPTCKEHI